MKILCCLFLTLPSCMLFSEGPPQEPPPLKDMETPLKHYEEPEDEKERTQTPLGGFSGVYVGDAKASLDDLLGNGRGLTVTKVVENSPGDFAGLLKGDLLLETWIGDNESLELAWPSQWRRIEQENKPGTKIHLIYDRAEKELETSLILFKRLAHPARLKAERFEEQDRVGVVLRTATEVEARHAGLGPGGGAVLVGLAKASPWRGVGMTFGDLIHKINDKTVDHPQVVLDLIREADEDDCLTIHAKRGEKQIKVIAPLTRRDSELTKVYIPLLFSYEKDRGQSETSCLFGLYNFKNTKAAWEMRLLWIISFGGGDSDRLEEVTP